MRSAADAVAYSRRFTSYKSQYCLNFVQTMLAAPWSGPYAAWAWQHAQHKHPGDANPPPGVPIYILGSRYGHIALSVGGGNCRSTDWPRAGRSGQMAPVGEVNILHLARAWGRQYVGWAEDLGGQRIPGIGSAPAHHAPPPSHGHFRTGQVYQHVCHEGVRNMDSVRNVQQRLIDLGFGIPAGPTGNWPANGQTTRALRAWQQRNHQGGEWATGRKLGFSQAQLLFRGTGMAIKP